MEYQHIGDLLQPFTTDVKGNMLFRGDSNGLMRGAHASTGPIRPPATKQCFNNLKRNYSSAAQCVNNSGYYDFKELSPSEITINSTSRLMASAWLPCPSAPSAQIQI